jgi:hypothetical protein
VRTWSDEGEPPIIFDRKRRPQSFSLIFLFYGPCQCLRKTQEAQRKTCITFEKIVMILVETGILFICSVVSSVYLWLTKGQITSGVEN